MSGPNHIAGGIVFTGIYLSMFDTNIYSQPHYLFFTAFFSLLPDIDHTKSLIGKPFFPIAKYLDKKFGHRTITHSLLCYFVLAVFIGMIEKVWFDTRTITQIFIWAFGSHLILDMVTIQGVPLLYPFMKNPCVIPGNPKFRFKSLDFKVESIAFVIFIMLMFTCKDLFENGFWNTYNRTWSSVKSLYTESLLYDKAIDVNYNFQLNNVTQKGKGILVEAHEDYAILFNKQFLRVEKDNRIINLTPVRTNKILILKNETFTNVSFDSLEKIISNKPIISLKLQSVLPISFNKENKPQSSNSIELEYIYNPVLISQDIDSLDLTTAKEIELTKQELSNNQSQLAIFQAQQIQYENQKKEAFQKFVEVQNNINSSELAVKEKAIKELPAAKAKYEQFNQIKNQPVNQINAINIKMNFLKSKLHIKKHQSINGFISYFIIQ